MKSDSIRGYLWTIDGVHRLKGEGRSSKPYTKPLLISTCGGDIDLLLAVFNNEFQSVTLSWNGDNGGEEKIDLK